MKRIIYSILSILLLGSCAKDFLDEKRDKTQITPQDIADYQAILDRKDLFNGRSLSALGEIGAADFYVSDQNWNTISAPWLKNAYIWAGDIFESEQSLLWNVAYEKILLANVVIEGMEKLEDSDEKNNILGQALFWRAYTYYQLSQIFCKDYQIAKNETDLGLPLRRKPSLEEKVNRSTLAETFRFMTDDLKAAADLISSTLPEQFGELKSRPSKSTVWALLSRIYLQIGDYEQGYSYAKRFPFSELAFMDYNNIVTAGLTYTFPLYGKGNTEVLLYETMHYHATFGIARLIVDDDLFALYSPQDLRKDIYYMPRAGNITFRGSYMGFSNFHPFPAVSEVALILAETIARSNTKDLNEAIDILYGLAQNRYVSNTFKRDDIPVDRTQLLAYILQERRRELAFRGTRWSDLRRLNHEPETATVLIRNIAGVEYKLEPLSNRYVFPLPYDEILLNGYEQNDR